jgi:succinate dehydrogenase / fumarate reductase membrane anchor subunit
MVNSNVMSFTRNGLLDWIVQRATAVILALYTIFMVSFFLANPEMDYLIWSGFMGNVWVKLFTLVTVLSIMAHAWIGMWTVGTDYMRKSTSTRILFELFFIIALLGFVILSVMAIWSV